MKGQGEEMKYKILCVDDDDILLEFLKELLKAQEFNVVTAITGEECMKKAVEESPDLILLDLNLPDMDGIKVCQALKQNKDTSHIAIILLTARKQTEDKINGLRIGADDYMTKPFDNDELIARIKAILRRLDYRGATEEILSSKDITINVSRHIIEIKNKSIKEKDIRLTPKEFDLLCAFLRKKGHVLSKRYLLETVWGYNIDITTRSVEKHIETLRKKIGPASKGIQTVPGYGYKFEE